MKFVGTGVSGKKPVIPNEAVKIILLGSRETVKRAIRHFHAIHFADPNDWSPLQPTQNSGEVITILVKRI